MINLPKKKTKIIATLGPATSSPEIISSLILNGVNVFRLNLSHGSHEEQALRIAAIKEAAKKLNVSPCILADLQGPKIRIGDTKDDQEVNLKKGSTVFLTTKNMLCDSSIISVGYSRLLDEIKEGQDIFINDGKIHLKVNEIDKDKKEARCIIIKQGSFSSRKGINLPNAHLSIPSITAKDKKDIEFILSQDIQLIALSFVRKAADLELLYSLIKKGKRDLKIIAKIETPEAVANIDSILQKCNGVMVARGDLGIEVSIEKVTIIQKDLINKANKMGKIVIVATEMLESMIEKPRPTRAEASDVANAILDGADCVMLSGETSIGKHPVDSVEIMTKIAQETEKSIYYPQSFVDLTLPDKNLPHSIAEAAAHASLDQNNASVVVFTLSGDTALYLSNVRTKGSIFAFSPDNNVVALSSIFWNTTGFYLAFDNNVVNLIRDAEQILIKKGLLKRGDVIVTIFGKSSVRGATDSLRIKRVGED